MNKVFIDTSAWIMLINKGEKFHTQALNVYRHKLLNYLMVTSNLVIGETYTWLQRKAGTDLALDYLRSIQEKEALKQLNIIFSDAKIENQAFQILNRFKEHAFSYVDAVSFAIMKKEHIKDAFAYDKHFQIAGFRLLT